MKKLILVLICVSSFTQAANGVFAINEVCASSATGCFDGDSDGFPITITQAGSYILTSNLISSSHSVSVITISTSNVTLDLNGFAIIGPRSCTGSGSTLTCNNFGMVADGINASGGSYNNIVIKNGSVKGFNSGIAVLTGTSYSNKVMNIQATQNDEGIILSSGVISDSQSNKNYSFGFSSALSAFDNGYLKVVDSYAYGNRQHSVHANICSNVFFLNNGATSGADNDCTYTGESICKVAGCIGL